jgi:ribosome biogenesis GTPase
LTIHDSFSFDSQLASLSPDTATLESYGWNPFFAAAFAESAKTCLPARIVAEHPGLYRFVAFQGQPIEGLAEVSGRMRHQAFVREDLPAVGDWVALNWSPQMQHGRIEAVLPRRSLFARKEPGGKSRAQIVATNVDTVLLLSALNQDLNLRRIERYLTLAWESGAKPVIVLSKADLAEDPAGLIAEVEAIALGTDVVILSAHTGLGLEALAPWLIAGQTVALLGSSGVGKSTLVNALSGQNLQLVQAIREDDARGRHTTTHRELFRLPSGALLLDTPGMRELQLWQAGDGLDASFADILEVAGRCRFRDCAHAGEGGCAFESALLSGELDPARLANWRKLQREEAWVERRTDKAKQAESKRRWKQIHQQGKMQMKEKYR